MDIFGCKGENNDEKVKERDRIGDHERHKRRHSRAVHREVN
jgi:hypothetical protein